MGDDDIHLITSLYKMKPQYDPQLEERYAEKRRAAIELLGDKYLLAKPVEKKA